jgi:hypothetical protein
VGRGLSSQQEEIVRMIGSRRTGRRESAAGGVVCATADRTPSGWASQSRTLRRLVERGLVCRNPGGRGWRLTPSGLDVYRRLIGGGGSLLPTPPPVRGSGRSSTTATAAYQLILGDSRFLPVDLSVVDAIITDPPYGVGYRHSGRGAATRPGRRPVRHAVSIAGDDRPFDPGPWLSRPCLFWGALNYVDHLPDFGKGGSWLHWDKTEGGLGPADSFADVESAWCSIPGITRNGFAYLWKGVSCRKKGEDNGRRYHPAQKPVELMRWCIRLMGLPPGSLILDPYAGSGTTILAALAEGYNAIGIEIDADHCVIARRRVEQFLAGDVDPC